MTTMKSSTLKGFLSGVAATLVFMAISGGSQMKSTPIERIREYSSNAVYYKDSWGECHEYHTINVFGVVFDYAVPYNCRAIPPGALAVDFRR